MALILCVHCRQQDRANGEKHAARHMKRRYGLVARCVRVESSEEEHPDITRERAHLAAMEIVLGSDAPEEGGPLAVIVESDRLPSRDPVEESRRLRGVRCDVAVMSGSVMHAYMDPPYAARAAMLDSLRPGRVLEVSVPADGAAFPGAWPEHAETIVIGEEPSGEGSQARLGPRGDAEGVRIDRVAHAMLSERFTDIVGQGPHGVLERLVECTRVELEGGKEVRETEEARERRRWILSVPTTMTAYAVRSRAAARRAADILRYTIGNSPLPNVFSYEKHVKGRMLAYTSLDPLCDEEHDPIVDYIHALSGLRGYPVNRTPVRMRTAATEDDGRRVCLGAAPREPLPKVSLITITRNRRRIFNIATFVFRRLQYPADRLEWVIVDDSEEGQDAVPALGNLARDPRVVYRRLITQGGKPYMIGQKREIACTCASGDVFFILDDDDYVPPAGVSVRVRALLEYGADVVGSTHMLSYVYSTGKTFFTTVEDVYGDKVCFGEPSLAFTRRFWEERHWETNTHSDEGRYFLLGRDVARFVNVPSHFHIVAITHGSNVTGNLRDGHDIADAGAGHFRPEEIFPDDFCRILRSVFRGVGRE